MSKKEDLIYPFGYGPAATGMMQRRNATANASLLLKHLTRGMNVLDVGCGPGSITVGLAEAVAPGNAAGIDIEASHINLARSRASELGLRNCLFEVASIFDLPFSDKSMDAVYGHAILMQFADLDAVMAEIRRVLKPGGLVSFREIDFGASLYHSDASAFFQAQQLFRRSIAHNGGNPDIGRQLPSIISRAGFDLVETEPSYQHSPTPDASMKKYLGWIKLWEESEYSLQAKELGWISPADYDSMVPRLQAEASNPDAFSATTYVEILARS